VVLSLAEFQVERRETRVLQRLLVVLSNYQLFFFDDEID
jgi:hypothetical protein